MEEPESGIEEDRDLQLLSATNRLESAASRNETPQSGVSIHQPLCPREPGD